MPASNLRKGMTYNGKRIGRTMPGMLNGRRVVVVTYEDRTTVTIDASERVSIAVGANLPAGPVREGWFAASTPRVRVTSGEWRGEKDGTRKEQFMAIAAAFGER
jgi:hypothetical protein